MRRTSHAGAVALCLVGCTAGLEPASDSSTEQSALTTTVSFQDGVAPTASYSGTRDTFLSEDVPTENENLRTILKVSGDSPTGTGHDMATLIQWDISSIPTASTVQSASITFYVTDPSGGLAYSIYPLSRSWSETEATWLIAAAGQPWDAPGARGDPGDRTFVNLGTVSATTTGPKTITLDADGVNAVQNWVSHPSQNHGLVISERQVTDTLALGARNRSTLTERPRLDIIYTSGVATTGCPKLGDPARSFPTDYATRLAQLKSVMGAKIAEVDATIQDPAAVISTWSLSEAALGVLVLGQDPAKAKQYLTLVMEAQRADGSIPKKLNSSEADVNETLFATAPWGSIFKHFGGCFSSTFLSYARPHLASAITALKNRAPGLSYTNAELVDVTTWILLAEYLGDTAAADAAYTELDNWIAYTHDTGIFEYDSPDYYMVDLRTLDAGYLYAARSGARDKFKGILDHFWTDIGANLFVGRSSLAGTHSRDYDRLTGRDSIDWYLYLTGWHDYRSPYDRANLSLVLDNELSGGYQPSHALRLGGASRVVTQWWGPSQGAKGKQRYTYLNQDVALSSVSADCIASGENCIDKVLVAELAGGVAQAVVQLVPDAVGDPYGVASANHLRSHPAIAQQDGRALGLFYVQPPSAGTTRLETNLLIPLDVDSILLDGTSVKSQLSASGGATIAASSGSVVAIGEGNGSVAFRVFIADGCGGQSAKLALRSDSGQTKAARLVVTHYSSTTKLTSCKARVGIVIAAGTGSPATIAGQLQTPASSFDSATGKWTASATLGGRLLEVQRDWTTIYYRRANGSAISFGRLAVNGSDVSASIFR